MDAWAVILEAPERLSLRPLALNPLAAADVLVEIDYSGISSGTEKLLWTGEMPGFPGMGYPLVPGYESVGRVIDAGADARAADRRMGLRSRRQLLSRCARPVRRDRAGAWSCRRRARCRSPSRSADEGILHRAGRDRAITRSPAAARPELIVGHGILGRLLARLTVA